MELWKHLLATKNQTVTNNLLEVFIETPDDKDQEVLYFGFQTA